MQTAGMITEYNPLHRGHLRLMEEARNLLGSETAVVCCMSGDFVQRGEFAVVRRQTRARAAVESGADLVLELPLPWAVSSAEGFARGAVAILSATGIVDCLVFGSESGRTEDIRETARLLFSDAFPALLREELRRGDPFPAARQRAAERLAEKNRVSGRNPLGETGLPVGELLSKPNDLLGVEYCKAILLSGSLLKPVAIRRQGAGHGDSLLPGQAFPSAGAIRTLLREEHENEALALMAPAMERAYRAEAAAGRAPVFSERVERGILACLRRMSREDFAVLDQGREGLGQRLYAASRRAVSVREVLETAKTRRYPLSRLRRMVLWAWLGVAPHACPATPCYLRPLAMNRRGQDLLFRMKSAASLPILSRPRQAHRLGGEALDLFSLEARAADLYALAYPDISASIGGSLWKERPWMAQENEDKST